MGGLLIYRDCLGGNVTGPQSQCGSLTAWTQPICCCCRWRRWRCGDCFFQQLLELREATAAAGGSTGNRTAQQFFECIQVYLDMLSRRLIQEVHAHHHRPGGGHDLQDQHQVPLQAGGVGYHQSHIRLFGEKVVPSHLLLGAAGMQRVGARQIHQSICSAVIKVVAPGYLHGLARPVPRVLAEVGQGVEQGRLTYIGVAHQGNSGAGGSFHGRTSLFYPGAGRMSSQYMRQSQRA